MSEQKPKAHILAFARNYEVFNSWRQQHGVSMHNRGIIYVSRMEQVQGVRDPLVLRLYGYSDNPIWTADLVLLLRYRNRSGEIKFISVDEAVAMLKTPQVLHVKQCDECRLLKLAVTALDKILFPGDLSDSEQATHMREQLVKGLAQLMDDKGWAGDALENEGFIEESVQRALSLRG